MANFRTMLALLLVAAVAHQSSAATDQSTPLEQVITMLRKMNKTATIDLQDEQTLFENFERTSLKKVDELKTEIKTADMMVEKLEAFIAKAQAQEATLTHKVVIIDGKISVEKVDQKKTEEQRAKEHQEYLSAAQEYAEAIDALEHAIQVMETQEHSRSQADAMMLLQRMARTSSGMRTVLAAVEETQADPYGRPEIKAYEHQSGGIIDMLRDLHKKFQEEARNLVQKEHTEAQSEEKLIVNLDEMIDAQFEDEEQAKAFKAKLATEDATAEGQLAAARRISHDSAKLYLEIDATLKSKTEQYEANQHTRIEEIHALDEALKVMKNPDLMDNYNEDVKGLEMNQMSAVGKAATLLQVGSSSRRVALRSSAASFLQAKAKALGSIALSQLSASLAQSKEQPMQKVVTMIEDLLEKLKSEASAEAAHKEWCDKQLKKSKMRLQKTTHNVAEETAELEAITGEIATMGEEIAQLMADQEKLTKDIADYTEQRTQEHKENVKTIEDAVMGQEAVKKAMEILKGFYAKEDEASLLENHAKGIVNGINTPELKSYTHRNQGGKTGGIIGMMEVIQSDFAQLEAETKSDEAAAAEEYEKFMADAKSSKAEKHEIEFNLKMKKDQVEFEKGSIVTDLEAAQADYAKAEEFSDQLKPNCLQNHNDQEKRAAMRQEEIEALKQTYKALSDEDSSENLA